MKTAEEWCREHWYMTEYAVKAIQLDGWKQGMTDAAGVCAESASIVQSVPVLAETLCALSERLLREVKETSEL